MSKVQALHRVWVKDGKHRNVHEALKIEFELARPPELCKGSPPLARV